jgi:predicted small metal-binding protein
MVSLIAGRRSPFASCTLICVPRSKRPDEQRPAAERSTAQLFKPVVMSLDSKHPVTRRRCCMAKELRCGDLMPGCDTVIVGKDADEVFAKAEAHARKEHNMTIIPPSVVSQIEAAIRDRV